MADYIEIEGVNYGARGKSFKFQGDTWDEPAFLPISQCEWVGDDDGDGRNHGTMRVPGWLAKKNGWD